MECMLTFQTLLRVLRRRHDNTADANAYLFQLFIVLPYDVYAMFCAYFSTNTEWCVLDTRINNVWSHQYLENLQRLQITHNHISACWNSFRLQYVPSHLVNVLDL